MRLWKRCQLVFTRRPIIPHAGLSNKSLGNQEAALSKEQMWHVVHTAVAFTLDTPDPMIDNKVSSPEADTP